jgi:hypothetical protein
MSIKNKNKKPIGWQNKKLPVISHKIEFKQRMRDKDCRNSGTVKIG